MTTDKQDFEPIVFGEHNVRAEHLSIGHLAAYFPWTEYFNSLGIPGSYPTLLYTNEKADALYEAVSSLLGEWIVSGDPWIELSLVFHDVEGGQPEGDLEVVLSSHLSDEDIMPIASLSLYEMGCYLLEAAARWIATQEAYGKQTTIEQKDISRRPSSESLRLAGHWVLRANES
ncbi:hypothetical protein [Porphyromonas gulae]|uniref:hypothetical protein n=1 Tax=Porphyromonas gulae TaxID=111105 RepID=UPI0026F0E3E3|nr:hypothetical protein [Porphyromonas gulae]